MKRFLGVVNMPDRCFLDRHIREGNRPLSPCMPFDLFGPLFEDKYVQMIETDQFDELVGKKS